MNTQDNVAGTVTTSYQWGAPGVNLKIEMDGSGCSDSLAWYQSNGNSFGNKPTTVPFSIQFTNSGYLYLRDESNGTKRYWYDVEVKTPAGGMVADNTTVQDVKVYAWPSMTEVPLLGSWTTWRGPNMYYRRGRGRCEPAVPLALQRDRGIPRQHRYVVAGVLQDRRDRQHGPAAIELALPRGPDGGLEGPALLDEPDQQRGQLRHPVVGASRFAAVGSGEAHRPGVRHLVDRLFRERVG